MTAESEQTRYVGEPVYESTNMDPRVENILRRAFKWLNRFMLLMWRLGLGSWLNDPKMGGQIMVIVHVGRKSGLRRQTPVNFAIVDGELYCTAGFGRISDWYRNIRVQPKVEVWLPHGRWMGEAEDVTELENYPYLMRQVLIGSGFAARLAGLDPAAMDNEELVAATKGYRLIHIRRNRAATGPGGPGDLAWIWPITTILLLFWTFWPKKRRRG